MPTGAAIALAGVAGAGATIWGANKAAQAQTNATDKATGVQKDMFDKTQAVLNPYVQGGNESNAELSKLLMPGGGVNMDELRKLPGYEFALNQGERGIENSAAARGLGAAGTTAIKAGGFATGLADQTFGAQVGRLMGRVQVGENAAAGVGNAAVTTGQSVGGNIIGAGNAQAGAYMASGNAVGNLGGDLTNAYMTSKLFGPGGVYAPKVVPTGVPAAEATIGW